VDSTIFGGTARSVKCANCGHQWAQSPHLPQTEVSPESGTTVAEPSPEKTPESEDDAIADSQSAETAQESPPQATPPQKSEDRQQNGDDTTVTSESAAEGGIKAAAGTTAGFSEQIDLPREAETPQLSVPPAEKTMDARDSVATANREPAAGKTETPDGAGEHDPIPIVLTSGPSVVDRASNERKRKARTRLIVALGVAAAVCVAVAVLVVARGPIMSAIPGSAGLYRLVGLGGDEVGAGLEIRDVKWTRDQKGEEEVLTVQGVVANAADAPIELPLVRVSLFSADGAELKFVNVSPEQASLQPGDTAVFEARIVNPEDTAEKIKVSFSPRSGQS
jgi:hypothetical protein